MSDEIFLMSVIKIEGDFGVFSGPVSGVDLHFPLVVELCSDWKWKFG
jgi:hypothetical protein